MTCPLFIAQGAATGLCLFEPAVRISPAVRDTGSMAHLARRLRNNSGKIVANVEMLPIVN
jgi:hypothetical protein